MAVAENQKTLEIKRLLRMNTADGRSHIDCKTESYCAFSRSKNKVQASASPRHISLLDVKTCRNPRLGIFRHHQFTSFAPEERWWCLLAARGETRNGHAQMSRARRGFRHVAVKRRHACDYILSASPLTWPLESQADDNTMVQRSPARPGGLRSFAPCGQLTFNDKTQMGGRSFRHRCRARLQETLPANRRHRTIASNRSQTQCQLCDLKQLRSIERPCFRTLTFS